MCGCESGCETVSVSADVSARVSARVMVMIMLVLVSISVSELLPARASNTQGNPTKKLENIDFLNEKEEKNDAQKLTIHTK